LGDSYDVKIIRILVERYAENDFVARSWMYELYDDWKGLNNAENSHSSSERPTGETNGS
jgi:hypothetical protein